jgi:hypothetical protein
MYKLYNFTHSFIEDFNYNNNDIISYFIKCQNYCKVTATYKTKEIIMMDRCFWEELPTETLIYKND